MPPRGRGGKFSKPTRGGGKHFSRNLQPLDKEGNALGMWREPNEGDASSDEEEEESSEEESSEEEEGGPSQAKADMSREERRAAAKAKKERAIAKKNQKAVAPGELPSSESESEDEDDMPANPNHTAKSRSQASKVPTAPDAAPPKKKADDANLSRREREALQAQQARERYQKLHAEGKTDEAKADLARLALVKERREAEAARKQAEKEEREERERDKVNEREAKLRAAAMGNSAGKAPDKKLKGKAKQ